MYPKGTCFMNEKGATWAVGLSEENGSTLEMNFALFWVVTSSHQEICTNTEIYLGCWGWGFLRRKGEHCESFYHTLITLLCQLTSWREETFFYLHPSRYGFLPIPKQQMQAGQAFLLVSVGCCQLPVCLWAVCCLWGYLGWVSPLPCQCWHVKRCCPQMLTWIKFARVWLTHWFGSQASGPRSSGHHPPVSWRPISPSLLVSPSHSAWMWARKGNQSAQQEWDLLESRGVLSELSKLQRTGETLRIGVLCLRPDGYFSVVQQIPLPWSTDPRSEARIPSLGWNSSNAQFSSSVRFL